jgi:hypothetical protein
MQAPPSGVTAIAVVFLLASAYLLVVGLTMLVSPGTMSMAAGAPLLGGLELAGPFMFLLIAAVGLVVASGLLWLHIWARRFAILVAMLGVVLLLPGVSNAVVDFRIGKLAWGGLGMILRVMIIWYLSQPAVREEFESGHKQES